MTASDVIRRQRARNAARREQIRHHAARGEWTLVHRLAATHQGQTGESLATILSVDTRNAIA